MGPITHKWYEDNKIPYTVETKYSVAFNRDLNIRHYKEYYCTGRIDIHTGMFGEEYGVEMMKASSWNKLGDWLNKLTSDKVLSKQEILDKFESETGHKIEWYVYEEN